MKEKMSHLKMLWSTL